MEVALNWVGLLGLVIFAIGAFCIIVAAFEQGIAWGLTMIFFGAVAWPVFVLLYWKETSYWFYWALTGVLIIYIF